MSRIDPALRLLDGLSLRQQAAPVRVNFYKTKCNWLSLQYLFLHIITAIIWLLLCCVISLLLYYYSYCVLLWHITLKCIINLIILVLLLLLYIRNIIVYYEYDFSLLLLTALGTITTLLINTNSITIGY